MDAASQSAARDLLERAGLPGDLPLTRLEGGGNNRLWRLGMNGESALMKEYFAGAADERDRLASEWGFINYAWTIGLRCLPRPLACAPARHAALYQFVEGRQVSAEQVSQDLLGQCADFIASLNQNRDNPEALALPLASEACLSLGAHLTFLERRLARLGEICAQPDRDEELCDFFERALAPATQVVSQAVRAWASQRGLPLEKELSQQQRCLSPSDFGFQNILLTPDGELIFLDFEYAGWDDPAKLLADFFAQPQVEIDTGSLEGFARRALAGFAALEDILERARALLPLHWLKWCCILLNEFLPQAAARREFAKSRPADASARLRQLEKSREHFERLLMHMRKR